MIHKIPRTHLIFLIYILSNLKVTVIHSGIHKCIINRRLNSSLINGIWLVISSHILGNNVLTILFSGGKFQDRVLLSRSGYLRIGFIDQVDLLFRAPPASVSRMLGLKVCTTTPGDIRH